MSIDRTSSASWASSSAAASLGPVQRARVEPRTSDRVYDALFAAIRDLHLVPGTRLSETELARQMQVSRTPIREAIARLVEVDLVQVLPQVGTLVAPIRLTDVEEARFVRENLESAALEIVCGMLDRDVSRLREHVAEQEGAYAAGDLDAFFAADEAMHIEIFALAGYPGAWQAIRRKKVQLDRIRRLSLPDPATLRELIDEHRSIVDAIESGTADVGAAHVRAHARRALVHAPALRHAHPDYFSD